MRRCNTHENQRKTHGLELVYVFVTVAKSERGNTLVWPIALEQLREAQALVPLRYWKR